MKTKLLRKVRKRFEIMEVTFVDKNDCSIIGDFYREGNKLPFYYLIDKKDDYNSLGYLHSDKNVVFNKLKRAIRISYGIYREPKTKYNKIWYNESKND